MMKKMAVGCLTALMAVSVGFADNVGSYAGSVDAHKGIFSSNLNRKVAPVEDVQLIDGGSYAIVPMGEAAHKRFDDRMTERLCTGVVLAGASAFCYRTAFMRRKQALSTASVSRLRSAHKFEAFGLVMGAVSLGLLTSYAVEVDVDRGLVGVNLARKF